MYIHAEVKYTIAELFCMASRETVSPSAVNIAKCMYKYYLLSTVAFPLDLSLWSHSSLIGLDNLYKTECSFHTPCINMY